MKNNKKKALIALVLVAAFALMSFGFAAWSSTLNIEGSASTAAKWDIHFVSVSASDMSGATVSGCDLVDEKNVNLGEIDVTIPGGWVEYTIVITNAGSVEAIVSEETFTPGANNVGINFDYVDITDDVLAPGEECTITLVVSTDDVEDEEEFVASGSITLTLVYDQNELVEEAPTADHIH